MYIIKHEEREKDINYDTLTTQQKQFKPNHKT